MPMEPEMTCHLKIEEIVPLVEASDAFRVLRRVDLPEGVIESSDELATSSVAAVLDVETTGLDHDADSIIELAIRRIRFDQSGRVLKIDRSYSWLEDPGRNVGPEITRITGLTDEELAGQVLDEGRAASLLASAAVIISHNAAFDRPFVEDRLPAVRGLPWACSCRQVPWEAFGFEGRSLGWLLAQGGLFHQGHRASSDVDALVALLMQELGDQRTVLAALMEAAQKPAWIVAAVGAHFDVKDRLKIRGYRWDSSEKYWWREVTDDDLAEERSWLADFVYRPDLGPRELGPDMQKVTWTSRFSRPPKRPVTL